MSSIRSMAVAIAVLALIADAGARVDVKVEFDKAFDFKSARSWGWGADGAGQVMMARTQDDDPEAMRKRAEPSIVDAVTVEMTRRGMQLAPSAPDLKVTYYLLLTTSFSAQTVGQFLPATTAWAVPPFAQATQSLEFMNRGSLVLDLSANGAVVWRGVAQANIKPDATEKKRETLIRESVRDLLRRYPPKQ
jgi:hypothetical protein